MERFKAKLEPVPHGGQAAAGAASGARVTVTIERDDQPLPTDVVPPDLAKAIAARAGRRAAWAKLSPAHKREHVKHVIEAKKPETRARRIAAAIQTLDALDAPRANQKNRR